MDNYANNAEVALGISNAGLSTATLVAPNPVTAAGSYLTGIGEAIVDGYLLMRDIYKKDWTSAGKNILDIGLSLLGVRALRALSKARAADEYLKATHAPREYIRKSVGRGKRRHSFYQTKEKAKADDALSMFAGSNIYGFGSSTLEGINLLEENQ